MEPPKFCKCHNTGSPCKLGESYYDDGTSFHYCKKDPCLILNDTVYDRAKEYKP